MNPLFLAIPSLLQTGLGLYQTIKGARQRDTQDAKMTLPPAFIEAENQLRAEASQTESPYSPYAEQLMQQQGQQAITGAKQVGTAGDILNTVSNVNYQQNQAANTLGQQNQAYLDAKRAELLGLNKEKAGLQQQMFEYNVARPEAEREAYKSAMIEGGPKNIMLGATSLMGNLYAASMQKQMLDLMGDKTGAGGINPITGLPYGGNYKMGDVRDAYNTGFYQPSPLNPDYTPFSLKAE